MKKAFLITVGIFYMAMVPGCNLPFGTQTPMANSSITRSEKPRLMAPDVPQGDLNQLAQGNTAFALDLYHAASGDQDNVFFSPYSVSLALAMTYAGSRANTEQQMAGVMHYDLPQDKLHPGFNWLDQELAGRKNIENGSAGADGKGFRLNVVNDIWGQDGYSFLSPFLDTLSGNYGAGLRRLDFQKDPDKARLIINDYISEHTEQRIKDLIPSGIIDTLTRLVLTNAIYFNASWLYQFSPDKTGDGLFTRLDGTQITVPMMHYQDPASLGYFQGNGFQAVEMPYEGSKLSMVILLPDEGQFESFQSSLNADKLTQVLGQEASELMYLTMPKFSFSSKFMLSKVLIGMGMNDAFSPADADFSGIDGSRNLYIGEVIHQAFVKVDEAGTEAAAATAVIMQVAAMPVQQKNVIIDRPFVFLIRDVPTGTILFMGRVLEPVQS